MNRPNYRSPQGNCMQQCRSQMTGQQEQSSMRDCRSGRSEQSSSCDCRSGRPEQPSTSDCRSGRPEQPSMRDCRSGRPEQPSMRDCRSGRPEQPSMHDCRSGRPEQPSTRDCRSGKPEQSPMCGCRAEQPEQPSTRDCRNISEIPTDSRKQLLCYIDEVSFAVYETLLFLDTHPKDQDALRFFREHSRKRNEALREYERRFGPLTIETADDSVSCSWEWMQQPWPWEGGAN